MPVVISLLSDSDGEETLQEKPKNKRAKKRRLVMSPIGQPEKKRFKKAIPVPTMRSGDVLNQLNGMGFPKNKAEKVLKSLKGKHLSSEELLQRAIDELTKLKRKKMPQFSKQSKLNFRSKMKPVRFAKGTRRQLTRKPKLFSSKIRTENEQWPDKHQPKTQEKLHIHKAKIKQVRQWLTYALDKNNQKTCVLLLCGPTGCGKTNLLKVLAAESKLRMSVWGEKTNIASSRVFETVKNFDLLEYESKMSQFEDFVLRSTSYPSIFQSQRKLTLIEQIPYIGKADIHEKFLNVVRTMVTGKKKFPIIFTITTEQESDGSSDVQKIFGDFLDIPNTFTTIKMNAFAPTLVKKALTGIAKAEKVSHLVNIPSIVQECSGDLRNAIFTLQFQALSPEPLPQAPPPRKKTSSRMQIPKSKIGGRDANFGIFHALGKVLYAKRTDSVEDILAYSSIEDRIFTNLLVDNSYDFLMEDLG